MPATKISKDKETTKKLAECVLFALKFLDTKSRSGLMVNIETGKTKLWQDDFMDALDLYGYVIDRDKFYGRKPKKGKRCQPQH